MTASILEGGQRPSLREDSVILEGGSHDSIILEGGQRPSLREDSVHP